MLPDLGEQLFPTPLAPKNVPDDNERKKPFVNRYCCNGPLGPLWENEADSKEFYETVELFLYYDFLQSMYCTIFLTRFYTGTARFCLSPVKGIFRVARDITVLHALHSAILETESWLRDLE